MADVIEAFLQLLIGAFFGSLFGDSRIPAIILQALFFAFVGYLFILRPQLKLISNVQPDADRALKVFWVFMLGLAAFGLYFEFEIWPAVIFLAVFTRAFAGKSIGFFSRIPSMADISEFSGALKIIYVAFYREYLVNEQGKPRKGHFIEDVKSASRYRRAREQSAFFIILSTGLPGVIISLAMALIIQPFGTLLEGKSLADVPRDFLAGLGTGLFVQLVLVGYSLLALSLVYGETYISTNPPSDDAIDSARVEVDSYFHKLTGGYFKLFINMLIFVVIGGVGTAIHVAMR